MLHIENLNLAYIPGKPILKSVSLQVRRGEIVGLIGMNGAGKSTLMRAVSGVIPYQEGSVQVHEKEVSSLSAIERQRIAYLSAEHNLYGEMTVMDNFKIYRKFYHATEEQMMIAIRMAGCTELLEKKVHELSSGQRQRVSIACATIGDFQLLLLDEPSNALDIETKKYLIDYIRSLSTPQNGILITSHNIKDIEDLCTRIYILRKGEILRESTVDGIIYESSRQSTCWNITLPQNSAYEAVLQPFDHALWQAEQMEDHTRLTVDDTIKQKVIQALAGNALEIITIESNVTGLEDAIMEIFAEKGEEAS